MSGITIDDIRAAAERIRNIAVHTPLKPSFELSRRTRGRVFLKLENTQDTDSFKVRGASNAILRALEEREIRRVVTASSGNHGRSVAYVAGRLDLEATICMTRLVPEDKIAGIEHLGASVVIHGDDQNQAVGKALDIAEREQALYVPPFDHPDVIAGQGTAGLEMLARCPELDVLIVPVSGGGLLSGVAAAARALKPEIGIVGVTCERDAAMYESVKAGRVVTVGERASIADALPGPIPEDNRYTFPMCRDLVDDIVPVRDADIAAAMRYVLDYERFVLEGAGAVSVAYVLQNAPSFRNLNVAAVCSGGNISRERLESIFQRFDLQ